VITLIVVISVIFVPSMQTSGALNSIISSDIFEIRRRDLDTG
jgi:hypothetical protein